MAHTILVDLMDEDGDSAEIELPACWEICDTCDGEGKHSHDFGAITSTEWAEDWSPEEQDEYMHGAYDRKCERCHGTGKVLVVDRAACTVEQNVALDERDEELAYQKAERAAERRMGC
jgi:hypothetical protein